MFVMRLTFTKFPHVILVCCHVISIACKWHRSNSRVTHKNQWKTQCMVPRSVKLKLNITVLSKSGMIVPLILKGFIAIVCY